MNRLDRSRGSSALEFTLIAIPLLFVFTCTFEMCRGMWTYHTLGYAVKEGTRYAVVHGQSCTIPPNSCTVTISQIAAAIQSTGPALSPAALTLTFTPSTGSSTICLLQDCVSNYATTAWPAGTANAPGEAVRISASYTFQTAMAMFWPGSLPVNGSPAVITFGADARESIQY